MTKSVKLFLVGISISACSMGQIMYPGEVTSGSKEVVFDYSADACQSDNSMDGAANAIRDINGNIQLFVPNHNQFRITGPDFDNLSPDCANGTIFSSDSDPNQANHNYKEWLSVPYTTDGVNMYGLVHNEFHGYDFSGLCEHTDVLKCWYNSITSVSSTDTGKTFTHVAAPNHLVAAIPYRYDKDHGYRQGAFSPTNIIKHRTNGYYYAFFHTEEIGLQDDGLVVMRTQDITDPTSWRMYDGSGFNTQSINPYLSSSYDTAQHVFHTIAGHKGVGGVYYSTYYEQYMMVFHSGYEYQGEMTEGVCFALSEDLINWGTKKMLYPLNASVNSSANISGLDYGAYPSIIDHNDTTRNFDEIGQNAYLYYVKWNNIVNTGDPNRDLIRVPITFSKSYVSGFTVTGTGNQEDANPGDGVCETPAGNCSFYAAIMESNNRLEKHADTILDINFNMNSRFINASAGAGAIQSCKYPVNIDGTTNQSATENTAEIDDTINTYLGVRIGLGGNSGLSFEGGNTTIKGLCISYPQNAAISFSGAGNNTVKGCFLGTSIAGTDNQSETNDGWGVYINNVPNITIGGENPEDRNLIVGGIKVNGTASTNVIIKGNFIGTDITGTVDLEESEHGISVDGPDGTIIGGTNKGARNVISGNIRGLDILSGSDQTQIINNYIGLSMDGSIQLGNTSAGISLAADDCTIKDNIIGNSGSGEAGLWLGGNNNTIQGNIFGANSDLSVSHPQLGSSIIIHSGANNLVGGYSLGQGNIITNSTGDGIATFGSAGTGNSFVGNSIFDNGEFGIDIGGDNMTLSEDVPEITLASVQGDSLFVSGNYDGTANSAYRVEFFSNPSCDGNGFGEGKTYLGYVTAVSNSSGILSFGGTIYAPSANVGDAITCLTTDGNGTTHEFSECFTAASGIPDIRLSTTSVNIEVIVGQNGSETITIYNDGDADLTWTSSDNEDWHQAGTEGSTISSGSFEGVTLNVFTSSLSAGMYTDTLFISSNDPDEASTQVEINLNVISPTAEGNTDTAFYEMQPNRTEQMTVYLKNTGTGTLTFTAGMGPGADILGGISPNSGSVAEGDSIAISVTMRSNGKNPGTYNDFVWFSTNDPDNPVVEIKVQTLVDLNVGIELLEELGINSWVSNKHVTIQSSKTLSKLKSIEILDGTGRLIHQWSNLTGVKTVHQELSVAGNYFIKYSIENQISTQKIIVK